MKKIKITLKNLWKDESGQGATEYILLLVVIVALVTIFGDSIKTTLEGKISDVAGSISVFK